MLASFSFLCGILKLTIKKHDLYLWGVFDISQTCDMMENLNVQSKNYNKI